MEQKTQCGEKLLKWIEKLVAVLCLVVYGFKGRNQGEE